MPFDRVQVASCAVQWPQGATNLNSGPGIDFSRSDDVLGSRDAATAADDGHGCAVDCAQRRRRGGAEALVRITESPPGVLHDESAHPEADLEWWFVQGGFEGDGVSRRAFLASVFRHRPESAEERRDAGVSLLLSVLADGVQRASSRIDARSVELALDARHDPARMKVDRRFIEAYREELAANGPPRPIVVDRARSVFSAAPFVVVWGDFSLRQRPQGFGLRFAEPETGAVLDLDLTPLRPRILALGIGEPATAALAYASYPSLQLTGRYNDAPIRGEAWFDHQWGPARAWSVVRQAPDHLVGWDWLGINLDDGTEILVIQHRDMTTRRVLSRCALVRRPGRPAKQAHGVTLRPRRYWESPSTHVRYPVCWQLRIADCAADLMFVPEVDAQELRIFGPGRCIWEGAGTVAGAFGDRAANGRARLELHGYGCLTDGRSYFDVFSREAMRSVARMLPRRVDEAGLARHAGAAEWRRDPASYNEGVAGPVWDLVARHGKQWRAIYNLLLLEALGTPYRRHLDIAAAMPELVHTGSLIIDDIEDDSATRRGGPTIHRLHGLDVAINAGNTLYFLPFLAIENDAGLDDRQRVAIYKLLFRALTRAHLGQALDIRWSRDPAASLRQWLEPQFDERILQMYADKTAAVIEASSECVCIAADAAADATRRRASVAFARRMGVAFQITDDVLGFGGSPQWGKTIGEDLAAGKTTYVIHRAFLALPVEGRAELARILCSRELRQDPAALEAGVALVRGSGALDACRQDARRLADEAWARFSPCLPPSEAKIMLRCLCWSLVDVVVGT